MTVSGQQLNPQRDLFAIPEDVAYFNCAYMSPLLTEVAALGEAGIRRKCAPWQIGIDDFFADAERFRRAMAALMNAADGDIAIVPSASYGVAIAARNVKLAAGQEVLVLEEQFPSNYYAWVRQAMRVGAAVRAVPRPASGDWTEAVLGALSPRVAVLAAPNCHWSDGGLLDLETIGPECRRRGIALVLDLTQSLGALPFDVRRVNPAFVVAATYKWLLGPYAIGALYASEPYHDGEPLEENWITRRGSERFSAVAEYTPEFAAGARRYDVGERANFALLPMAVAAAERLRQWGVANIAATLGRMNDSLAEALTARGFRVYPRRYSAPHFLSLRLPEGAPSDVAGALARQQVYVSVRGRSLRITPHLYNTEADCRRLIAAVDGQLATLVAPRR